MIQKIGKKTNLLGKKINEMVELVINELDGITLEEDHQKMCLHNYIEDFVESIFKIKKNTACGGEIIKMKDGKGKLIRDANGNIRVKIEPIEKKDKKGNIIEKKEVLAWESTAWYTVKIAKTLNIKTDPRNNHFTILDNLQNKLNKCFDLVFQDQKNYFNS